MCVCVEEVLGTTLKSFSAFFTKANTCVTSKSAAKLRFGHVPFKTVYCGLKGLDRKCVSYFVKQKQCSDSNLIITIG